MTIFVANRGQVFKAPFADIDEFFLDFDADELSAQVLRRYTSAGDAGKGVENEIARGSCGT